MKFNGNHQHLGIYIKSKVYIGINIRYLILFISDRKYFNIGKYLCPYITFKTKIAIEKSYTPNLKGCQAKTTHKWCFPSLSRIEFDSE